MGRWIYLLTVTPEEEKQVRESLAASLDALKSSDAALQVIDGRLNRFIEHIKQTGLLEEKSSDAWMTHTQQHNFRLGRASMCTELLDWLERH